MSQLGIRAKQCKRKDKTKKEEEEDDDEKIVMEKK